MPTTTSVQCSDPATVLRALERVRAAVPMALLADSHPLAHVDEYTKFLALKLLCDDVDVLPPALSPSRLVDAVWCTHMMHPHEYARTCAQLLDGRRATSVPSERMRGGDNVATPLLLKHSPVQRVDPERCATTMTMYETAFGIKPNPLAWSDEAMLTATSPATLSETLSLETESATAALPVAASALPEDTPASCKICIKMLTGKSVSLLISPDMSVDKFMGWIQYKTGTRIRRLEYAGRSLVYRRTLSDYGIQSGATLYQFQRRRGC